MKISGHIFRSYINRLWQLRYILAGIIFLWPILLPAVIVLLMMLVISGGLDAYGDGEFLIKFIFALVLVLLCAGSTLFGLSDLIKLGNYFHLYLLLTLAWGSLVYFLASCLSLYEVYQSHRGKHKKSE